MYKSERQLIGIAGDLASGKDSVGNILRDRYGFAHVSCSDFLREYMSKHSLGTPDRETITRVARELRTEKGASFIIDQCLEDHSEEQKLVLSGIYSPAEAVKVKEVGGHMFAVICRDEHARYLRILERGAIRDDLTFEQFLAAQEEENSGKSNQQNISAIVEHADFKIFNEGSRDELESIVAITYGSINGNGNGNGNGLYL